MLIKNGLKQVGQTTSAERGTLVTFSCCINAVGHASPSAYIFPRVNFRDHMINRASNGSLGLATQSGRTNSELFLNVLEHFIEHIYVSVTKRRVLVVDNHESHISVKVVEMALSIGVVYCHVPPTLQ